MYHLHNCLRKKNYRYIGISVVLSPIAGFLSLVRVAQFSSLRRVFRVLNHKYINWTRFLGILLLLSLISNYFCAFTAFVLLLYIFFQRFLKPNAGFSCYTLLTLYK